MVKRIHDAGPKLKRASLFILTDGHSDLAKKKSETVPIKGSNIPLRVEFWDIERLSRVVGSGAPQSDIEIDVVAMNGEPLLCVPRRPSRKTSTRLSTIVPGSSCSSCTTSTAPPCFKGTSVRSSRQREGEPRDTGLLKQRPGRFLAYNNGISLTAEASRREQGEAGLASPGLEACRSSTGARRPRRSIAPARSTSSTCPGSSSRRS